jgi:hypothetical protein
MGFDARGGTWRRLVIFGISIVVEAVLSALPGVAVGQEPPGQACRIEAVVFEGWQAQQISNRWVKLVIVPQLGGRIMQLYFEDHPYFFVNPKYKGQYFPPVNAGEKHRWFNYGGDKIWPMPEGDQDEHHWPGPLSDPLDDGNYAFQVISTSPQCAIRLDGPPDPKTGLQYSREITLAEESPEIRLHAIMKNIQDHPIQWSMQSVTQYDTKDPQRAGDYNRDFWAFTPANPNSAYPERYHVRSGLADDPSFRFKDGLFSLHWLPLENEVWLDSVLGWLAVVDATTQFGLVEHFHYFPDGEYPGKATVIFYKSGSGIRMNDAGFPELTSPPPDEPLRYTEAELNSPIVTLVPGQTYAMDTEWNPVRIGKEIVNVTDAGVCATVLQAARAPNGIHLRGTFAVFVSGSLEAELFDAKGAKLTVVSLASVRVERPSELDQTIIAPKEAFEVSIHLIDANGKDRGVLATGKIDSGEKIP